MIAPTSRGAPTARTRGSSARTRSRWAPTTGRSASTCSTPAAASGMLPVRQGVHLVDRPQQQQHDRRQRVRERSCSAIRPATCGAPEHDDADDAARHLHELLRRLLAGRLARELEVHVELRPSPRARRRHARGEQQLHGRLRSRRATSALIGVVIPASVDPTGGTPARTVTGGLMYAGVNGNPTQQGNPPKAQVVAARRRRLLARLEDRAARRLRTVLGAVELSGAEQRRPATTARSASRNNTVVPADRRRRRPSRSTNPFPNGLVPRVGSALGALSGVGTTISFVDQNRDRAARAAVLGRPAARAAGRHGDHGQLHRRARRSPAARRHDRHRR